MAIHLLWYRSLSQWAVMELGWEKTIKEVWTSVEEWHHYDRFYLLLIHVVTTYLTTIVPGYLLLQPLQVVDAVKGNASATLLVRFLFEFGYPYLALRNAIRINHHETIDLMWIYSFPMFRATGKNNYAGMSVYVTAIRHAMVPELQLIWTLMRTASFLGYLACNVPWDLVQERMNRDCKQYVSPTTNLRDRLRKVPSMLNAFRWIWARVLHAMGRQHHDAYERTDFKQKDKDKLLKGIQRVVGTTWAHATMVDQVTADALTL